MSKDAEELKKLDTLNSERVDYFKEHFGELDSLLLGAGIPAWELHSLMEKRCCMQCFTIGMSLGLDLAYALLVKRGAN